MKSTTTIKVLQVPLPAIAGRFGKSSFQSETADRVTVMPGERRDQYPAGAA